MIATGIVRRIDDLGRVVIPREIRRSLRIKEGDPLEIFTTREGEVIFKKYSYCDEQDFAKAKEIVKALTDVPFGIYDNYGDLQTMTNKNVPNYCDKADCAIYSEGDIMGFIYFDGDILIEDAIKIKKVLSKLFSNNAWQTTLSVI